jgi:hypothetical protein
MSTSDDPTLGDTAMASGSDAGGAGEHLGPADLEPDEQRLLQRLRDGAASDPAALEDPVAAVRAAEDEAPLPARGGSQEDGLDVVFDPPGEG